MTHRNTKRYLETPINSSLTLRPTFRLNLMNIWGLGLLFLVSFSLFVALCTESKASVLGDPAEKVAALENLIKPQIQQAVDWSMTVGLGLVSSSAFYALVIRVIKL